MKRVDVPAVDTESGEPLVHITARPDDMNRLRDGIGAYGAFLRKLSGYGVTTERDPAEVDAISDLICSGMVDVEISPQHHYGSAQIDKRVELSRGQADLLYVVAQTMVAQALETAYLNQALVCQGDPSARPGYSWYESGYDAWQRFEQALAPPQP